MPLPELPEDEQRVLSKYRDAKSRAYAGIEITVSCAIHGGKMVQINTTEKDRPMMLTRCREGRE
jgi:hypothetical protein